MNVLDLFSGIGGFSLGLERAGMNTVTFCEVCQDAHSMRKTWGYGAYQSGKDLYYIQAAFSHSTSRITLAYIGVTRSTIEQMYRDNEMIIC